MVRSRVVWDGGRVPKTRQGEHWLGGTLNAGRPPGGGPTRATRREDTRMRGSFESIDTQRNERRSSEAGRWLETRTSPGDSGSESRVRHAIGSGAPLLGAENGRVERALEADAAGALRMCTRANARERLKRTTKHRCRRERAWRRALGRCSGCSEGRRGERCRIRLVRASDRCKFWRVRREIPIQVTHYSKHI